MVVLSAPPAPSPWYCPNLRLTPQLSFLRLINLLHLYLWLLWHHLAIPLLFEERINLIFLQHLLLFLYLLGLWTYPKETLLIGQRWLVVTGLIEIELKLPAELLRFLLDLSNRPRGGRVVGNGFPLVEIVKRVLLFHLPYLIHVTVILEQCLAREVLVDGLVIDALIWLVKVVCLFDFDLDWSNQADMWQRLKFDVILVVLPVALVVELDEVTTVRWVISNTYLHMIKRACWPQVVIPGYSWRILTLIIVIKSIIRIIKLDFFLEIILNLDHLIDLFLYLCLDPVVSNPNLVGDNAGVGEELGLFIALYYWSFVLRLLVFWLSVSHYAFEDEDICLKLL